jgi:hypothetical protein
MWLVINQIILKCGPRGSGSQLVKVPLSRTSWRAYFALARQDCRIMPSHTPSKLSEPTRGQKPQEGRRAEVTGGQKGRSRRRAEGQNSQEGRRRRIHRRARGQNPQEGRIHRRAESTGGQNPQEGRILKKAESAFAVSDTGSKERRYRYVPNRTFWR